MAYGIWQLTHDSWLFHMWLSTTSQSLTSHIRSILASEHAVQQAAWQHGFCDLVRVGWRWPHHTHLEKRTRSNSPRCRNTSKLGLYKCGNSADWLRSLSDHRSRNLQCFGALSKSVIRRDPSSSSLPSHSVFTAAEVSFLNACPPNTWVPLALLNFPAPPRFCCFSCEKEQREHRCSLEVLVPVSFAATSFCTAY